MRTDSSPSVHKPAPSLGSCYWVVPGQLLAGEHTDSFSGSMEGAVRSGRRAAAAIDALL